MTCFLGTNVLMRLLGKWLNIENDWTTNEG
jgi:hypothetical protein